MALHSSCWCSSEHVPSHLSHLWHRCRLRQRQHVRIHWPRRRHRTNRRRGGKSSTEPISEVRGSMGLGDGQSLTRPSAGASTAIVVGLSVSVPVYRPQACRLCGRTTMYLTRSGLSDHATVYHGCWYIAPRTIATCVYPRLTLRLSADAYANGRCIGSIALTQQTCWKRHLIGQGYAP